MTQPGSGLRARRDRDGATARARASSAPSGAPRALERAVALLATVLGLLVFAEVALHSSGRLDRGMSDIAQVMAACVATLALLTSARRHVGSERRAWLLFAASCASWAFGQTVFSWTEVVLEANVPFPSPADVGYLLSVPLAVAGALSFNAGPRTTAQRVRTILEGLTVSLSVLFIAWALVLGGAYRRGEDRLGDILVGLTYPVGDVLVLTLLMLAVVRTRRSTQPPLWLLAMGAGSLAIADSAAVGASVGGSYMSGGAIDLFWVAGFLFMALAGLVACRLPATAPDDDRDGVDLLQLLLPYAFLPVVVVVAAVHQAEGQPLGGGLLWMALALLALLVARQLLVVAENHALEDSLAGSLRSMEHRAGHDPLTDLANRIRLLDELAAALDGRPAQQPALLFIDLDRFKAINDGLGHEAGDQVLRVTASRLRARSGPTATVARIGGDEFVVLLPHAPDQATAMVVANRVAAALREPIATSGGELVISASIGVARADERTPAPDALVRDADVAMYRAKELGGARVEAFDAPLRRHGRNRLDLDQALRRAVERREFAIYYQPIVELATGAIVGAEALLRWRHPERGLVTPRRFLVTAEDTGLIVPIGQRLRRAAFEQIAAVNRSRPGPPLWLAVNLAGRELLEPGLADEVQTSMEAAGLDPTDVVLQVAERSTDEALGAADALAGLQVTGARIGITGFGMGSSSLAGLRRYPVSMLKVDSEFVRGLGRQNEDEAILAAVATLTSTLGLTLVAGGVTDQRQVSVLRSLGCDLGQGLLWAPPGPLRDLVGRLGHHVTVAEPRHDPLVRPAGTFVPHAR